MIESIVDIGEENGEVWLRLKWLGLPDENDFTWQRLSVLREDAPEMLMEYLHSVKKKKVAKKALSLISSMTSKDVMGAV